MEELKKEMMAVIAKYNGIRKAGRWIFPAEDRAPDQTVLTITKD